MGFFITTQAPLGSSSGITGLGLGDSLINSGYRKETAVNASLLTGHGGTTLGAAHLVTWNTPLMWHLFATTRTTTFATRSPTRLATSLAPAATGATSFGPSFSSPLHLNPPSLIPFGVLAECYPVSSFCSPQFPHLHPRGHTQGPCRQGSWNCRRYQLTAGEATC
jgi:hypothetical protein